MIERVEVKTYKEKLICEKCGGEMEATGEAHLTNPPQFLHLCQSCGYTESIRGIKYPTLHYEEVS